MADTNRHPASFRDPSGFVFRQDGLVYRAVQPIYQADYDHLMQSGLYSRLQEAGLMAAHEEMPPSPAAPDAYKILKPAQLDCWTYPYEWCFGQLKAAALLTLKLAATGLEYGMILKDASAYNIQFAVGRPLLVDSLSFEMYEEGRPWQAFRQFCDHFLNPLLVLKQIPELTPAVLVAYPEGFSATLTAAILPWKSRLSWNSQLYVYLAARIAGKKPAAGSPAYRIAKKKILQNLGQLQGYIGGLRPPADRAAWSNYYEETILSQAYLDHKVAAVRDILSGLKPRRVLDAGCNTGTFSLLAASLAEEVIAMDNDAGSVERLFREAERKSIRNLQVLLADIANPTPASGWANREHSALTERVWGDMVFALALVHHLALARNIPLAYISSFFAGITRQWLLIEFVPKSDPKAQLLLQFRKDIFTGYSQEHFEAAIARDFSIEKRLALAHSERVLYLLRKKER
jgi:SAM-dependent methyltransferase